MHYFLPAAITSILLYRFVRFLVPYLRPSTLHTYRKPGAYAMVTGATDGIGKAIALELAKAGFNIILHGRNRDKLQSLEAQIRQQHPAIDVQLFDMDASAANDTWPAFTPKQPLAVLVNNVGIGPIRAFQSMTAQEIQDTININALFPTKLTRAVLPFMPSPGLILNVSSYAGIIPPPYLSVYAGTKAYNHAFSVSLNRERDDIEVISLITGSVQTGANTKPVTFLRPAADTYARHVLKIVGCGRNAIMPYWPHAIQTWLISLLPARLIERATKIAMQKGVV